MQERLLTPKLPSADAEPENDPELASGVVDQDEIAHTDIAQTDIAIIGMAGRFPGASSVDELWANLCAGVDAITHFSDEELRAAGTPEAHLTSPDYVKARGSVDGIELFDAAFFGFTPREAEITDPQHRVFLECCWEALELAGCDPERYDGLIGVFAGAGANTYVERHLSAHPERVSALGTFQALISNDKDHLTTQVAYRLDLRGPTLTVQTACSSSLVAVHLACSSLASFDCDVALAGGVSIGLPNDQGYFHRTGGITSSDGVCRAFDAAAGGTVPASGAGVVVLKRLADALADSDHVYAVVRGTAVNNDGSARAGYTAPGVDGQAEVVAAALALADVDPRTVGYVEAHGTGTAVGDPIEVAALSEAFGSVDGDGPFCALGSVKSNLGHLDTAAGVTGLIKTALALEHGVLPPSLHCPDPSPAIDFASSPFYPVRELTPWHGEDSPRRAGVSSFGIGGTNAHAVLEEAPRRAAAGASRRLQLLTLTARTPQALDQLTRTLGERLAGHPELDLADVAFTLATGRRRFEERRILVTDAENASRLVEDDPASFLGGRLTTAAPPVVFLFPGQGAQHLGMAAELYASEASFRARLDQAAEQLEDVLGGDLRKLLWPTEQDDAARARLAGTAIAQPALFAVEVALAELWMSWGIEPAAMLGHSLGELTAACLAGVFSFSEALDLVAWRGRTMAAQPPGEMLGVSLPAAELEALLGVELSLAAINGPRMSVATGPAEAVASLAARLAADGVEHRRLETSHAFHSAMMDPVIEPLAESVAALRPRRPERRFLSNVSGTWITDEEAVAPAYWARQARQPVRFSAAVETLLSEGDAVFLEVGPGRSLAQMVRAHRLGTGHRVLSSLPGAKNAGEDALESVLTTLGRLWLAGIEPDWRGFHGDEQRRRVALPTYPFERRRCWLDAVKPDRAAPAPAPSADAPATEETAAETDWLAAGALIAAPTPTPEAAPASAPVEPEETAPEPREDSRPNLDTPYVAPRSELEERLCGLWQRLLGVEPIGINDNFFELGGHSLLATQVIVHLRDEFAIEATLGDLFELPTVAALAERFGGKEGEATSISHDLPRVAHRPEERFEPFPLTDVQQAYWLGRSDAFELGNVATHVHHEIAIGELDVERFTLAWRRVIDRHEMLRAVILPDGRQRILETVPPYTVELLDLEGLPAEEAARRLAALRAEMSHQMLDAGAWPLFDIRASRLGPGEVSLHLSFDILIADPWSWSLLLLDLFRFYAHPERPLEPLELSFRDYVLALEELRSSELYGRSLAFWRDRLSELPPAPQLPLARRPESLERPHFVRRNGRLDAAPWERFKQRAGRSGLTASGALMAVFAEVLQKWSKSPRLTINLTLFNRLPLHPAVSSVVGDFTSLTLLAVDGSRQDGFRNRARRLQTQLWQDLEHRYVSGVTVLRELARQERSFGRALMPVVFTSTLNIGESSGGESDTVESTPLTQNGISQTPQVWLDHQVGEDRGALVYNWDAVEDLFPADLLDDMMATYDALLKRLAEDDAAWESKQLELLPAAHRQLYRDVAERAAGEPVPSRLEEAVGAAVESHGERPAVIAADRVLSFAELDELASRLAGELARRGARRERLVAVMLDKGWRQAVAVHGVLRSGAAYLPIDPALPAERVDHLLRHGEVELVVTTATTIVAHPWPEGVTCLDVDEVLDGTSAAAPAIEKVASDLAYVIYTSGSTGQPKGVMIEHRAAMTTLADINRRFAVTPEDRVLSLSSLSFDLSVYDLFGPLAEGGAVVLPDGDGVRDPRRWLELMAEHRVTIWNTVPALLTLLVDEAERSGVPEAFAALRLVLLSGDWIPVELPARLRAVAGREVEIISLGGATEAAIWSIFYPIAEVEEGWASIPYGRPLSAQLVEVLDERLEPRPLWTAGEIYISGAGLARGYWRDEERTAQSFVEHPRNGRRLYRTGDLGRYLPDGDIEFLGREDFQVKVQGHRIELGEIEAKLLAHPAVGAAVVLAVGERHAGKQLVAFVVAEGLEDGEEVLRLKLAEELPAYMVPTAWHLLPRLPLTANGKIDRKALEELVDHEPESLGTAPRGPVEERVAAIWREVLGVEVLGAEHTFYDLGGDSLLAIRVLARLREAFQVDLPLRTFFAAPTIAGLATALEDQRLESAAALEERLAQLVAEVEELSDSQLDALLTGAASATSTR